MKRFDVVNIGAAGSVVVRTRVAEAKLRAEITRRVPIHVDVMFCSGSEILRLVSRIPFDGHTAGRDLVPFVSVMATRRKPLATFPLALPPEGDWCLKVLSCEKRVVLGLYRRQMKALTYLHQLEKVVGVSLTTRNWSTILGIERVLRA